MRPLTLASRVSRTIDRRALFAPDARVAVALSGGADSVALAWLLRDLASSSTWTFVGVIHVNHGLRGAESDGDEAFCRALASRLDVPIDVERVDVRARARAMHQSLEAAARHERYGAFARAADRLGAAVVATAHTEDDQAETVLLRLFRGASGRGMSAIRPRRGIYARPFIDTPRAAVRAYLQERGETAREDSSNADERIPRNRLRRHLLPLIVQDWPGAARALARFAELASDDEQFLEATAAEVAPAVSFSRADGVELDVRALSSLPAALARRVIRDAVERTGGRAAFAQIEAIRRVAGSRRKSARLNLAGVTVERQGQALRFDPPRVRRERVSFEYDLPVPGTVRIVETDWTLRASFNKWSPGADTQHEGLSVAVLQADQVALPLTVRSRRPGDRLRPLGAPGRRKLQDLFVDRKVPRDERDAVPLVVDAMGRILWVAGVEIADECRVMTAESRVVILELEKGKK